MTRRWLFSYALLTSSFLSFPLSAECIPSPDCADLGYDKTSCPTGDGVLKCPFDISKVKCIPTHCKDITCAVGDIYYSDKTCSAVLISGKTPIGVVGYVSNGGKNGFVVALDTAYDNKTSGIQWGCFRTDLSLTNYADHTSAQSDFSGKSNTDVIVSQCGTNTAAYYCKNTYSKGGVNGWYLPAYGELYTILYTNFNAVNTGLGKISDNNTISNGSWHWSSSELSSYSARTICAGDENGSADLKNRDIHYARCVLAF